jgi:hypothetical protein
MVRGGTGSDDGGQMRNDIAVMRTLLGVVDACDWCRLLFILLSCVALGRVLHASVLDNIPSPYLCVLKPMYLPLPLNTFIIPPSL